MARGGRGSVLCLLLVSAMFIFHCFSTSSPAAEPIEIGYLVSLSGVYAAPEPLKKTNVQVRGREFVNAMRSLELMAPRGNIKFDEYGAPIQNYCIRKVQTVDGQPQNVIVHTYSSVSQFWTWSPAQFMGMRPYAEMKGEWAPK